MSPFGTHRIQFDFTIGRARFRPTLPWVPNESNMRRARALMAQIKVKIPAGVFSFAEEFPDYRGKGRQLDIPSRTLTCSELFNDFLQHCDARVIRGDLSPSSVRSHRQILDFVWRPIIGRIPFLSVRHSMLAKIVDGHAWSKKTYNNVVSVVRRAFEFGYRDHPEQRDPAALLRSARIRRIDRPLIDPFTIQEAEMLMSALHADWGEEQGNYDEFRFFTGLRPSEQIALLVTDWDAQRGVINITKARVAGVDRNMTKTAESRRVTLCPRALAVLKRQLHLHERLSSTGHIRHQSLFFDTCGAPFQNTRKQYGRWYRTLRRLPIRYRKPYVSRHSSVSWNLMIGRNALLVAKEHGHSPTTMLSVYAAWADGMQESDVPAIRFAMGVEPQYVSLKDGAEPKNLAKIPLINT